MLSIALTGGIASGKSTVLKMLSRKFAVMDSDAIVSALYRNKKICNKIKKFFGTCDKETLAGVVFSSKSKRKKLEAILHPFVLKEIKKKLALLEEKNEKIAFVEVPLLFESGFNKFFDFSLCVFCTREQQISRLQKKGFSRKQALQRISAQIPLKQKIKSADFLIDNSKTLNETRKQTNNFIKIFKELIS